jgi:hypothetical protein
MLHGLAAFAHFRRVPIEPRLYGLKDGYNMKRVMRILGVGGLIEAIRT